MASLAFLLGFTAIWHTAAKAASIEGVWANKSSACADIFAKSKKGVVLFRKNSEAFGSGFIIEGDKIRGKMLACKIVRRNEEGDKIHLLASCSSDVVLDTIQFSLRLLDDKHIVRLFPGIPELEFSYERCSL
jgi:hypothetical protein